MPAGFPLLQVLTEPSAARVLALSASAHGGAKADTGESCALRAAVTPNAAGSKIGLGTAVYVAAPRDGISLGHA